MSRLQIAYGPLPIDPGEQNQHFYQIHQQYKDEVGVLHAHRLYLAARDIGIINLILFILLPALSWWATGDGVRAATYAGGLLLIYLLTAIVAKNYGERFVRNTLAIASTI